MNKAKFTTAIGSPLTDEEKLHEEGLELHLADQWNHGISNILVAGTMGAMQLLTDEVYRRLVERSIELWADKGEIMVGAGDAGFARTRDRILFLNNLKIDGIAVLAPYFWNFSQTELIDYYSALADESKKPLYLYDLPQLTGTKLAMETFKKLAKHHNIVGAKVSGSFDLTRQLIDEMDSSFRIIVAQPDLVDVSLHHGIYDLLDGMWAIAPGWTVAVGESAQKGNWQAAAQYQKQVTTVRNLLPKYGFAAFTAFMNARDIPGFFTPRPFARLTKAQHEKLLNEPIVRKLILEDSAKK